MEKFFNTAGPIVKKDHYYISSFNRIDYEEVEWLINQKKYFILTRSKTDGKNLYAIRNDGENKKPTLKRQVLKTPLRGYFAFHL